MKNTSKICLFPALIGVLVLIAGCASVSVTDTSKPDAETQPPTKPDAIYVMAFDTANGEFNVDREGAELDDFKQNLQQMMNAALTTEIPLHLVPSQVITSMPTTNNVWFVTGKFTKVNQGSRLLRSTIGFGAGGTKMEASIVVYHISNGTSIPFLSFNTTGGSGAMPGMISGSPVSAAIGAASGAAKGVSDDTARTSHMITAMLSDYMYNNGWITADKKLDPKMGD